MDTTQETESIRKLVLAIKAGNIVLPEFQRDFVWEVGKTHDLFDSLVKDIFIGSIIYGIPSFEITVREVDTRPRKGKGSRAKLKLSSFTRRDIELRAAKSSFRLVLDGQQRITSLYRALLGHDTVWFVCKLPPEIGVEFESASCEQLLYEFAGQEHPERLSIKLSDVFDIMEGSFLEDEVRAKYFQEAKAIQGLPEQEIKVQFRRYMKLSRKIQDLLTADKLLSYYLLNTTTEKFSLFFERSNSKGIQLNFTDILAAKLYAGFNLRNAIESFQESYPQYSLNREVLVRAVAFLVSGGKQIDRNYILNNLAAKDFNEHWDRVTRLYRSTIDFLYENSFIISQEWMPYDNMLLPVMFFIDVLGGDPSQMNRDQLKFFKCWYWCAIFSERYSASTNEVTTLDANVLAAAASGNLSMDRGYISKFKVLLDDRAEIQLMNKKGSVLYTGLLNLVNFAAGGLTDWKNGSKLLLSSKLEDHHIFPKEFLNKQPDRGEDISEVADSVANRTLIPKITNIKIGEKPPSVYLGALKVGNSHLGRDLRLHLVPEETETGLYDDFYRDFLEERSKLMFQVLDEHVLKGLEHLKRLVPTSGAESKGSG